MPAPSTADEFLQLLARTGLLDPGRLDEYVRGRRAVGALPADAGGVAGVFLRDGLLTPFQAREILRGRWRNFFLSGKYKVLGPLGAGGMAQVFLCEHTVMRRRVALKVLPPARADDPDAVARFHREARAAALVRHPNIVEAHDVDQDGRLHFLVMEYVEGRTLHNLVREGGPLPPGLAADYARQAALGLQHAHEAGLVHRDVKPGNLLVDRSGVVKVLDLGLARFFREGADDHLSRRHPPGPMGTAGFMAPEQAADSHAADVRSDVYGLGATLYFLLAGRSPQPALAGAGRGPSPPGPPRPVRELRPEVPEGLAAVLERMTDPEPDRRYQTPAEAAAALAEWSKPAGPDDPPALTQGPGRAGGPLAAVTNTPGEDFFPTLPAEPAPAVAPPAAPPSTPRRARRRRATAWLAAAVGLLAVGAVAVAVRRGVDSRQPGGSDGPPDPAEAGPRLRLLVPAYFYPSGKGLADWERLLRAHDPSRMVVVVNPDSGPGKVRDRAYGDVLGRARQRGITLIGYVSTRHGARPAHEVRDDIGSWVFCYPEVTGVFFDEQASGDDRVEHYAALYAHAHTFPGLSLVVGNPGTVCVEGYLSRPAADAACLAEAGKDFAEFRPPPWAQRYPPARLAALVYHVEGKVRMAQLVSRMADQGLGYCYLTDAPGTNPWSRLPDYWEDEVAAVRAVNARP